ncbi:AAA family ATPase [Teredinibacter sp. KSP-S5-2]|uniref:AAA family ATPase n=1 Tax=Teredinibacter sp. KSP-S5-2 TaxID=3034506 RepID=UPI00293493AA|nr:AAA family ATPase [Teredinibacter sp. KSP-S5-2]WNO10850.1 AAA family ATPase [Teredinibacter sp. KSP-S5-2]
MNNKLNLWLSELKGSASPRIDECVLMLKGILPRLSQLKNTEQDPEWHGEGDVHVHTGMVLEALYQILSTAYCDIHGERRQALILAALLHDIGKPVCTRRAEVRGVERVISPGHEDNGRSYLAYKLCALEREGLSHEVISSILGLVGEHHMPKLLVVRNRPEGAYLALSRKADCELLYYLEVADMTGRNCPDKSIQLDYLEQFKLFCQEYNVWGSDSDAYKEWRLFLESEVTSFDALTCDFIYAKAIKDREEGVITMPEEAIAKSFEYRDDYSHLVVVCAPSGAGKSTWIKNSLPDYKVVSLDDLREELGGNRANQKIQGQVLQEAKKRLKQHLSQGHKVVWDATSLRFDFRKQVIDIGCAYHAMVTLVVFQLPEQAVYEGNKSREHAVPDEVLARQLETAQWPTPNEAHRFIVINEDYEIIKTEGVFTSRKALF